MKFKFKLWSIFILFIFGVSFCLIFPTNQEENNTTIEFQSELENNIDILGFWNHEINRVNRVDLNIEYGETTQESFINPDTNRKYSFEKLEIHFNSPNWVGANASVIKIHGYLLFPNGTKFINSGNAGCLLMHGLNGEVSQGIEWSHPYLEKGLVVLTYSHPGHGQSEGARPSHKNFYFEDDFNKSSHFYLTICAAIQGVRLLESLYYVDNSRIIVAGGSYGALNTIFVSGIIGSPRIAGAIPCGALGDLNTMLEDPTKLLLYVFDKTAEDLKEEHFEQKQALSIDPKYYLKSAKLPPILFQIGTNDEFFYYRQINGTLDSILDVNKFIQIYPNAHHGFPDYQNTSKFFVDYLVNNGQGPPRITVENIFKTSELIGEYLNLEVEIDSKLAIDKVEVYYRYLDILGSTWESIECKKGETNQWTGYLFPGVISSRVDYYIRVKLVGSGNIWFSSRLYTLNNLNSNITFWFYLFFIGLIGIPSSLLMKKRIKDTFKVVSKDQISSAKKNLTIELILIGVIESLFYISLFLPWIVLESGPLEWTHVYIFNNIFTWKEYFGWVSVYFTIGFIIGWIVYTHLSIMRPMLAGLIKVAYPILVFFIFAWYLRKLASPDTSSSAQIFGAGYPGVGLYLMLACSIAIILLGIWKRYYQSKLNIREVKTKWYNLDRWFRFKNPIDK